MEVNILGGRIEFTRYQAIAKGRIPGDLVDAAPQFITEPVEVQNGPESVSLASKNIQIVAAKLRIHEKGNIQTIGWVNVILESTRAYHYGNDELIVTEQVPNLPQWDGGGDEEDELPPFYQGNTFYSDDHQKHGLGDLGDLEGEDLIFNDAPCLPPSRDLIINDNENRRVGLFEVHRHDQQGSVYLTRITGLDRYLACLVVGAADGQLKVAWSVPWNVAFRATVARKEDDSPDVTLAADARTSINVDAQGLEADDLVNAVRAKDGTKFKTYTATWAAR